MRVVVLGGENANEAINLDHVIWVRWVSSDRAIFPAPRERAAGLAVLFSTGMGTGYYVGVDADAIWNAFTK